MPTFINMSGFFEELHGLGFDGTGYKYTANDLIGGYTFICRLHGKWTEIQFERGQLFINRVWDDLEAAEYIKSLQVQGKLMQFSSKDEMFT